MSEVKRSRGRPTFQEVNERRAKAGRKPVVPATPKNNSILPQSKKARAQEVLAAMLGRKGKAVVQKVLDKALDDNDEDQMACLKLVMDRVLPADYLAKAKTTGNAIQIQIMGVDSKIETVNAVDAEFEEINE